MLLANLIPKYIIFSIYTKHNMSLNALGTNMYDGKDMRRVEAVKKRTFKMHALGRPFQLGDLYDYRSDCILAGNEFTYIERL